MHNLVQQHKMQIYLMLELSIISLCAKLHVGCIFSSLCAKGFKKLMLLALLPKTSCCLHQHGSRSCISFPPGCAKYLFTLCHVVGGGAKKAE
jgi:hypothetical protein